MVIDLGTGDGRFVYRSARRETRTFFIGIDPNVRPLAAISEKIYRRSAKGGAPNVLYLQAAVEELPDELAGVANEVHIQFPWGSLLRAVGAGDEQILKSLRRICCRNARLEVLIGLDPERDASQLKRLAMPELSPTYLKSELVPAYEANGFVIENHGILPSLAWPKIESTWAAKLRHATRTLIYLHGRAN